MIKPHILRALIVSLLLGIFSAWAVEWIGTITPLTQWRYSSDKVQLAWPRGVPFVWEPPLYATQKIALLRTAATYTHNFPAGERPEPALSVDAEQYGWPTRSLAIGTANTSTPFRAHPSGIYVAAPLTRGWSHRDGLNTAINITVFAGAFFTLWCVSFVLRLSLLRAPIPAGGVANG